MVVDYLFAAPGGDIRLVEGDLAHPFMVAPGEPHPFLTLGDYFRTVEEFLRQSGHWTDAAWVIRSEKHGALYHIASAETEGAKFAVTAALSSQAQAMLTHEFEVLRSLAKDFASSFLPGVLALRTMDLQVGGNGLTMTMMLGEWLDDYHEWHLSRTSSGGTGIRLWDYHRGPAWLSVAEEQQLIRQVSRILTLYYDPGDFRQIHPWHHAAGDFVARRNQEQLDVKLITARDHVPFLPLVPEGEEAPLLGLLCFFLHLALRMRLDRLDGTGEMVWLPERFVGPLVAGFLDGLTDMASSRRARFGGAASFLDLLQFFDRQELQQIHRPLLDLYASGDPEDFAVIVANLDGHIDQLLAAIGEQRQKKDH